MTDYLDYFDPPDGWEDYPLLSVVNNKMCMTSHVKDSLASYMVDAVRYNRQRAEFWRDSTLKEDVEEHREICEEQEKSFGERVDTSTMILKLIARIPVCEAL